MPAQSGRNEKAVNLPGRNALLPHVLEATKHVLVNKSVGHKRIIILVGSKEPEHAQQLLEYSSKLRAFATEEEIHQAGFLLLDDGDMPICFWRDINGSQDPKDDVHKLWCVTREWRIKKGHEREIAKLKQLQRDLRGDERLLRVGKATKDPKTGEWSGGIAYERDDNAKNLKNGERCYPGASTNQDARGMEAPSAGRKYHGELTPHDKMNKDMLRAGAVAGMAGIHLGPPSLLRAIKKRAQRYNCPRIGYEGNYAFGSAQLNVQDAETIQREDGILASLGRAGVSHADGSDSCGAVTSMTNVSADHPQVRQEVFFIFDLGIAITMRMFTTVLFSGLHYHCGQQCFYDPKNSTKKSKQKYVRLTLIMYPPTGVLHGSSSSAFALSGTGSDVVKIMSEAKNIIDMLNWTRPPTAQATYTVDGRCVMDLDDHANYIGRGIVQLIFQVICQAPRDLLMRFDCMSIFNAITYVNGKGKCVQLEDWPEMPGWVGKDVELGTAYTPNLSSQPPDYLNKLFNSDDMETLFPFGRSEFGQSDGFDELCKKQVPSIPLCILAEKAEVDAGKPLNKRSIGGHPTVRKKINEKLRPEDDDDDEAEDDGKPTRKKGQRKGKKCSDCSARVSKAPRQACVDEAASGLDADVDDSDVETPYIPKPTRTRSGASRMPTTIPHATNSTSRVLRTRSRANAVAGSSQSQPSQDARGQRLQKRRRQEEASDADPRTNQGVRSYKKRRIRLDVLGDGRMNTEGTRTRLLDHINMAHLLSVRESFQAEVEMVDISQGGSTVDSSLLAGIVSLCASNRPHDAWELQHSTLGRMQQAHCTLQKQRANVMLSTLMLWEWLEYSIEKGYLSFLADEETVHWLGNTLRAVHAIVIGSSDYQLDANRLVEEYTGPSPIYVWTPSGKHRSGKEAYVHIVRCALSEWYGFCLRPRTQLQAAFMRALIDSVGLEIVALPSIWEAFESFGSFIPGNNIFRVCRATLADITAWATVELPKHALTSNDSEEKAVLHAVYSVLENGEERGPSIELVNQYRQTFPTICDSSSTTIHRQPAPSLSSPPSQSIPHLEQYCNILEFEMLRDQLIFLFPILDNPTSTFIKVPKARNASEHLQNFCAMVQKGSDKLLPFRDLAISRKRILEEGGPFSAQHLRTPEGFFSALVYRGITHNSLYLKGRSPKTMFQSKEEWLEVQGSHPSKHLCDRSAYGATAKDRSVNHAEVYWSHSRNPDHNSWLLNPSSETTFLKVFQGIKKHFPAFGPLTAYLLVADYAIAGAVPMPSFKDMGNVINTIKLGGRSGLIALGFEYDTPSKITKSLQVLDRAIRASIPYERLQSMKYDIFVLEHMLCKFGRLKRLSGFQHFYPHLKKKKKSSSS